RRSPLPPHGRRPCEQPRLPGRPGAGVRGNGPAQRLHRTPAPPLPATRQGRLIPGPLDLAALTWPHWSPTYAASHNRDVRRLQRVWVFSNEDLTVAGAGPSRFHSLPGHAGRRPIHPDGLTLRL